MTESLRSELRGAGVDVTCVVPGVVNTELAAGHRPTRGVRVVEAEDVANGIVAALRRPRAEVCVPAELSCSPGPESCCPTACLKRCFASPTRQTSCVASIPTPALPTKPEPDSRLVNLSLSKKALHTRHVREISTQEH